MSEPSTIVVQSRGQALATRDPGFPAALAAVREQTRPRLAPARLGICPAGICPAGIRLS